MDMFDEAKAMAGTLELCKITQSDLAKRLGVSQSYVANKLRLLGYSEDLIGLIRDTGLTERHARTILRLHDEEERRNVILKVSEAGMSVRECEALVDSRADVELPKKIGRACQLNRISTFKDGIRRSVESLCSLGVEARSRTSYKDGKMYITVMIGNP